MNSSRKPLKTDTTIINVAAEIKIPIKPIREFIDGTKKFSIETIYLLAILKIILLNIFLGNFRYSL